MYLPNFYISEECIHIENSYMIKDAAYMKFILIVIMNDENYKKFNYSRKLSNYIAEWKFHNWCYNFHLFRKRTKDVDLDNKFSKTFKGFLEDKIYSLISLFYKKYDK